VAELVVALSLLLVAEDLICLGDLLELLFRCLLVIGVLIRVEFRGEFAERLLDLVRGRVLPYAEDLVVVALRNESYARFAGCDRRRKELLPD